MTMNPPGDLDIAPDSSEVRKTNSNPLEIECYLILGNDDDDDDRRNSRNIEEDAVTKKERNKVIDTEDCSRGPLSGCIRLADSSRVIQRLKVSPLISLRTAAVSRTGMVTALLTSCLSHITSNSICVH